MNKRVYEAAEKLISGEKLSLDEYVVLIENSDSDIAETIRVAATEKRKRIYGNSVFVRGLIEISNVCKNDCYYCGIRRSNAECERYRLTFEQILECCRAGYEAGFRTFVLQGGEDGYFTDDRICAIIGEIKRSCPDSAVTLSLGERSRESYALLKAAGADRYLLRHETADEEHYGKLHPKELSFAERMRCLRDLRELGFQTGCGFMVGSPYQTSLHIAKDLEFISEFRPDMCGIGPFIPQKETPFRDEAAGSAELTCFLLSVIRLIHPAVLLPATTALGTVSGDGRERGILSGANVVMPNLSPSDVRSKYKIYDNKLSEGAESIGGLSELKRKISAIGYEISLERGDVKKISEGEE